MGSKSYSVTTTTSQDQRTAVDGDVGAVAAPGSLLSMPGSVAIAEGGQFSSSIRNEFTPEVAATIANIVDSKDRTIHELVGVNQAGIAGLLASTDMLSDQGETVAAALGAAAAGDGRAAALGEDALATVKEYAPWIVAGVLILAAVKFLR